MPDNEAHSELIKSMSAFPKEIEMYDVIIPKLEDLCKNAGILIQFSPKCFLASLEPEAFTMEDLSAKKFVNVKRQKGLDLTHTKYALSKLAKFHAASAVLCDKEGPFKGHFLKGAYDENFRQFFNEMMKSSKDIFKECVSKWGLHTKYVEKIDIFEFAFDKSMESLKIDPNGFNVLNHGDMWTNNLMFQYDDAGNISEMFFVDLQISKYGSPAQDLNYFIISSCNFENKIEKFDYLIKYYHEELISCLKLMRYSKKMPNLIDLQCDVLKRGFFGVSTAVGVMCIALLDQNDDAELHSFVKNDENSTKFKNELYSNPRFVEQMHALLPWFDNKGLLDP